MAPCDGADYKRCFRSSAKRAENGDRLALAFSSNARARFIALSGLPHQERRHVTQALLPGLSKKGIYAINNAARWFATGDAETSTTTVRLLAFPRGEGRAVRVPGSCEPGRLRNSD